ncbi:MAG: TRAP transporter substrate-binding protein [Aquamicrobium sp.]|uniref:TRAP transporter substrate-binding protein n=1 Tax=Aquamicrobium sp. TaxID=1872579 RepID=UPI00349EBE26|nr:TRAP transporter substrate-binding protein [Aquamicrobium sp.]
MLKTTKACLAAISVALLASGTASAQDYPKTNLNVQGGWATAGIYQEIEVPFWTERLPSITGGNVTATIASLNEKGLKGPEVFRLMRTGVIDFGTSALGYVAGDDPQNEGPDLAGIALDIETARKVSDAYKATLSKLYMEKYGIRLLMLYPAEAQVFWCNSPIASLADLRGKKVRTGNRTVADFVEAAGGVTVTMPFGEVVTSLQLGVIDCAVTGTFSGNSAGWHEVTTHLYPLTVGWSPFMYAVNAKRWEKLDPSLQTLLTEEFAKLEDDIWSAGDARTTEGLNCATGGACTFGKPGSMTLVPLAEADSALRAQYVAEVVLPRFAERCGEACIADWNQTVGSLIGIEAK